jgi:nitrilase
MEAMRGNGHFKLAAIQAAPVVFDREGSAEKACRLIKEAGAMGATIAAFGETWLPGYPFFAFSQMRPLTWQAMAEYLASAVDIPSPTTDKLCAAAKAAGINVVIGVVERDTRTGCSSGGKVEFWDATVSSSRRFTNAQYGARAMRQG